MDFIDLLKSLHASAQSGFETYLTYDAVQELPPDQFAEMERLKILVETQPSKYYTCRECPAEDCSGISLLPFPDRETGKTVGVFSCCMEGGEGLKKVDLNRLRQWDILPDRIEAYLEPLTEASHAMVAHESDLDSNQEAPNKETVSVADWGRSEDKTRVCKWIHQLWLKRGKPSKADIVREAMRHFHLPHDYYHRVRKEYNQRFDR